MDVNYYNKQQTLLSLVEQYRTLLEKKENFTWVQLTPRSQKELEMIEKRNADSELDLQNRVDYGAKYLMKSYNNYGDGQPILQIEKSATKRKGNSKL